jgi:hypothetical protein
MKPLSLGILLFALLIHASIYSQKRIIPPSPEAAALGRYGDFDINLSTGMLNHNIPLYTIQTNKLSLPVSLQYAGGGIKVNELASWVGLGWVLQAGGVITRSVRGFPDENAYGFYYSTNRPIPMSPLNEDIANDFDYLYAITEGNIDTEPDMFYFNFGNYSGKFVFDNQGIPTLLTHEKLKIVKVSATQFEITDASGIKYVFKDTETTIVPVQEGGETFISSWYLSEIVSNDNVEKISFYYTSDASQSLSYPTQSDGISLGTGLCSNSSDLIDYGHNISYAISGAKTLNRIEFKGGKILFTSIKDRQDISWGAYRLTSMQIIRSYTSSNTVTADNYVKGWDFSYSYLNGTLSTLGIKRLLLTHLSQRNFLNDKAISQDFEYYDAVTQGSYSLPVTGSKQQDQWGYYNGVVANENLPSMIPTITYNSVTKPGANRESGATNFMQAGSLKKIIYPTGGSSVFEYESNDIGGGFRNVLIPYFYLASTNIGAGVFTQSTTFSPAQNTIAVFTFSRISNDMRNEYDLKCTPVFTVTDLTTNTPVNYPSSTTSIVPVFAGQQTDIIVPDINLIGGHNYRISVTESDNRCDDNQPANIIAMLDARLSVNFSQASSEMEPVAKRKVGGLRVKSITNYIMDGQIATKKRFNYESTTNTSSGNLLFEPLNGYFTKLWRLSEYTSPGGGPGGDVCLESCIPYRASPKNDQLCDIFTITSGDVSGLGTSEGHHIQYTRIIEEKVDVNNVTIGKTEHYFSFAQDLGHAGQFPFPPPNSLQALRAKLDKQIVYDNSDRKIQESIYDYQHNIIKSITALKVGRAMGGHPCYLGERPGTACRNNDLQKFIYTNYNHYVYWSYLKKKTVTEYDVLDHPTTTVTEYEYNNDQHLQLTKQTATSSSGQTLVHELKYPQDYSNTQATSVINDMKNTRHIHNEVIQEISKLTEGGVEKIVSSKINVPGYFVNSLGTNSILPVETATLQNASPINTSVFPNYIPSAGYSLTDYRKDVVFSSYDVEGNPREKTGIDGIVTAIIWGYNSSLPVAEVKGISYSQAISQSGINMSIVNNVATTDASMRAELNKLRTLPMPVMVNTFTYLPLLGMTSQSDANGLVTYYEYDDLGRLLYVRNNDQHIIKKMEYQYFQNSQ